MISVLEGVVLEKSTCKPLPFLLNMEGDLCGYWMKSSCLFCFVVNPIRKPQEHLMQHIAFPSPSSSCDLGHSRAWLGLFMRTRSDMREEEVFGGRGTS